MTANIIQNDDDDDDDDNNNNNNNNGTINLEYYLYKQEAERSPRICYWRFAFLILKFLSAIWVSKMEFWYVSAAHNYNLSDEGSNYSRQFK